MRFSSDENLESARNGSNTRDQFFADGLTDELNHALAHIRELAARLDVDGVIEGSIRRFGDRLRILVQLDDAADGCTVWSQTYDRKLTSSFEAQQEIASAIRDDLAGRI